MTNQDPALQVGLVPAEDIRCSAESCSPVRFPQTNRYFDDGAQMTPGIEVGDQAQSQDCIDPLLVAVAGFLEATGCADAHPAGNGKGACLEALAVAAVVGKWVAEIGKLDQSLPWRIVGEGVVVDLCLGAFAADVFAVGPVEWNIAEDCDWAQRCCPQAYCSIFQTPVIACAWPNANEVVAVPETLSGAC